MKKRMLAWIMTMCMVLSLLPVSALAVEEEETPSDDVCTCETLCTEDSVNEECPVCQADPTQCKGEKQTEEEEPGETEEPKTPANSTLTEEPTGAEPAGEPVPYADGAVYVSEDGDDSNLGTSEEPFATLKKAADYINGQPMGGTYTIYVMSDLASTACARFYDCHVTITSVEGNTYTVTRGKNFSGQHEPARGWYNPAMLEIGKAVAENGEFLWDERASLTLENIVFDDGGLYEGDYFLQAGIEDLPEGANSQNIVQDAIVATYNNTADITLGDGTVLENFGGMSAVRVSGGTITMESGSKICDSQSIDRVKGEEGSFGPAGAVWLQGGTLIMDQGSEICDMVGRGVYADGGTVTISGTICNITGDPDMWFGMDGIAVHVRNKADATLDSTGIITEISGTNTASAQSVVNVDGGGRSLTIKEKGQVTNCENLHHVIFYNGSEPFEMHGILSKCKALNNGNSTSDTYIIALGYGGVTMNLGPTGSIKNNEAGIATIYVVNNGTINIRGEIDGNIGGEAGGVYLYNHGAARPVANLYETGRITNNKGVDRSGGVIASQSSTFNMYGGLISGNDTVTLSGGTGAGAGVFVRKNGQFTMTGGKIVNNKGVGITYETSNGSNTFINIEQGEISGSTDVNIEITGAFADNNNSQINLAAGTLKSKHTVETAFGTLTFDSKYPSIAFGNAKTAASTAVITAAQSGEGHQDWTAATSSALWFQPTADTFHFTMPRPETVENGRVLYAAYIPLNADGTAAAGVEAVTVPVENAATLDVTLENLTAGQSYALALVMADEYIIRPDDITIYVGGDEDDGFPEWSITNSTPENMTVQIDGDPYTGDLKALFTVTYMDGDQILTNDQTPGEYTAKIDLSAAAEEVGLTNIEALTINGNSVQLADGVLTIRSVSQVQAADDLVTEIVDSNQLSEDGDIAAVVSEALGAANGKGIAVISIMADSTNFYTNGENSGLPGVQGPVALLFDDLLSVGNREQMLIEQAESQNHSIENRQYQFKYLDLVDTSNGNAWVSTSQEITIYWPYPAGTNQDTKFDLLHFTGLHREYGNPYGEAELSAQIAACAVEAIQVKTDENGIYFTMQGDPVNGNFSPFALVWGEVQEPEPEEPEEPDTPQGGGNQGSDYTLYYHSNFGDDKTFYQSDDDRTMEVRDYEDMSRLPDREGYEFVGWNTEEDGSGDDYAPGDEFRMTGRRDHLYAMWERVLPDPDDTGVSRWLNTDDHDAYLSGYPDNTFGPDRSMTRAEVAQMFYALLLDKDVPITVTFSDVPADAWYAEAVNTLASLGMVEGYADGTFRPDNTITRAEFVTIAVGFADLEIDGEARFTDVARNAWYYPYIADACAYGWIGGYPDGSFRPDNTITRAEVTVIVNNMLGRAADERYVDRHEDELRQFGDLTEAHWAWYPIAEAVNSHDYTGSGANERWR